MSDNGLTASEQAQFDQMRQDDASAVVDAPAQTVEPTAPQPETSQAEQQRTEPQKPAEQHPALVEERERRKAVERQNRALEERMNLILQRFAPAQPQPEAPAVPSVPKLEEDPLGNILGRISDLDQRSQQLTQRDLAYQQQQQAAATLQQIHLAAVSHEQEFRKEAPDYDQAAAFLMQDQNEELLASGLTDPAARQHAMQQRALGLTITALQQGANPAERIYALAKRRGYKAVADAAAPAGAQDTPTAPDAAQRLQQIGNGQRQAQSVGNLRGSSPAGVDARRVANMSNEEFGEFYKSLGPRPSREKLAEVFGA